MSIRLPIHVAASISALAEMYPRKTKTDIIGDLLSTSIDQVIEAIPSEQGDYITSHTDTDEPIYETLGEKAHFYKLQEKYIKEIEKEIDKGKIK